MKKNLLICAAMFAALTTTAHAQTQTGRQLDLIGDDPSGNIQGFDILPVVGIFWDERCAAVEYTFNSNVGANPGTEGEISPEELAAIVQTGLDRWNDNPSSYIKMDVTNITDLGNRPRIAGDFINEVTFITDPEFGALASSPSMSLSADATFLVGDDLDGDGDSDVFDPELEQRNTCGDVDGDGDIEFPAGDYAAGTILDNDVQFGMDVVWEAEATSTGAADVDAVSTHEFGHSHGLNHAFINQISDTDGTTSTMFPFISTTNAAAELGSRTPHTDDLAASAHIYQEGNGTTPISELQEGDVAFDRAYSLVSGSVVDGTGLPIPGAAVNLTNEATGSLDVMTYSGRSNVVVIDGGLNIFPGVPGWSGDYVAAVPSGNRFTADIEALDGSPAAAGNISINAIIADIVGLTGFPEEGYTPDDAAFETFPERTRTFFAGRNGRSDIDFVINNETVQRNAGDLDFGGTGAIFGANDIVYAEMFDRNEVSARIANGDIPVAGLAETFLIGEAASVATYSDARLAIGRVDAETGVAEITKVLSSTTNVVAQDSDATRFPFMRPSAMPFQIRRAFNRDPEAQLFFLLEVNDVELGPNQGFPLGFVGLDVDTAGTSFLSTDNGPLNAFDSTFLMELRYVNDGRPVAPFLQDGVPTEVPIEEPAQ